MTKGSRSFLSYLRAYLDEQPGRRRELIAFYREKTGANLNSGNLARFLALQNEPRMDATIVFLNFLHQAGELKPGKKGGPVFTYARPEILK